MGRKRIHFSPVSMKKLGCKTCGKQYEVTTDIVEVQCDTCLLGLGKIDFNKPIDPLPAPLPAKQVVKEEVEIVESVTEIKPKRGRGRPRKNALPTDKKGNTMAKVEKKMDVKGGTGKRGRKATVGSAVLNFIKEQKGDVKFTDILNVYSQEREKLGKKSTPEIEARNAYSTLYVLARDGKIREVQKKSIYAAC